MMNEDKELHVKQISFSTMNYKVEIGSNGKEDTLESMSKQCIDILKQIKDID